MPAPVRPEEAGTSRVAGKLREAALFKDGKGEAMTAQGPAWLQLSAGGREGVMADTETQRAAFEDSYEGRDELRWSFHFTQDSLVRYLRDRRLNIAMQVPVSYTHLTLPTTPYV